MLRASTGPPGAHASASAAAFPEALRAQPQMHHRMVKEPVSLKAQLLFESAWRRMEDRLRDSYVCPGEVVWLNGAPGSGKGTNMPFIMKSRGLSRSVGMSQLLDGTPEIKEFIERGELVPDAMVLDALLDALLNPASNDGAGLVIDGFPRTALQVDFVKLLHDRLQSLSSAHADAEDAWRFPRPSFKVVILYVDEEESLRRQMNRAKQAHLHNKRVQDAGAGDVWDVRTTDINEQLCRRRYKVFKMHYQTILRLKQFFPFSLIDAMGTLEECRAQIMRELRYQSSLDLDAATYDAIRHLPLARDLVRVARQRLVSRLDAYCKRAPARFAAVIGLIERDVLPLLRQSSLAGHAVYRTVDPMFYAGGGGGSASAGVGANEATTAFDPVAAASVVPTSATQQVPPPLVCPASAPLENVSAAEMLIDILTDRGFSVAHSEDQRVVPRRVDLATGEILCDSECVHVFRITFDKENVRDLSTPVSITTAEGEETAIGTTSIPSHLQRESLARMAEAGAAPEAPPTVAVPACHIDPRLSCLDPVLGQDLAGAKCGDEGEPEQGANAAAAAAREAEPVPACPASRPGARAGLQQL
ncbi:hypothetical protein QBZ16_002987 [Prototheca wickerhamii]|uniref:adenylate kinase n=1 Tax=Prototheca wickerhamii TaxID=3111 RepID=A0AAD9IIZ6_PROWI|nr:hypothetical protein QBZ16_002987 [Prototheca wickerhamii]